jgi:hypothetical protein
LDSHRTRTNARRVALLTTDQLPRMRALTLSLECTLPHQDVPQRASRSCDVAGMSDVFCGRSEGYHRQGGQGPDGDAVCRQRLDPRALADFGGVSERAMCWSHINRVDARPAAGGSHLGSFRHGDSVKRPWHWRRAELQSEFWMGPSGSWGTRRQCSGMPRLRPAPMKSARHASEDRTAWDSMCLG